jgi:hypothetical protein
MAEASPPRPTIFLDSRFSWQPEFDRRWLRRCRVVRRQLCVATVYSALSRDVSRRPGMDQRLCDLRRRAWVNLAGGVAGARLGMAGIRELFDEVLRVVAPESAVEATAVWQARTNPDIKKPTRRMRIEYVLGEKRAAEADALLQFERSIQRTQKFVHTFADDVELVRAQMTQLEIWIYLLLQYGTQPNPG